MKVLWLAAYSRINCIIVIYIRVHVCWWLRLNESPFKIFLFFLFLLSRFLAFNFRPIYLRAKMLGFCPSFPFCSFSLFGHFFTLPNRIFGYIHATERA